MNINAEKALHTGEVAGSIPAAPTTKSPVLSGFIALSSERLVTFRDATKRERDGSIRGITGDFDLPPFPPRRQGDSTGGRG